MATDSRGTSGGVKLDDKRLLELADEAERGYESRRLRPRRGRPPLGSKAATVFQVRIEPELRDSLERRADAEGTTPSEITRRALRHFLASTSASNETASPVTRSKPSGPVRSSSSERRDVMPSPEGGWDVRKPSSKRASSHHATQKDAIQAARRILRNEGGGELLIKGRDGRIRDRSIVSRLTES